MKFIGISCLLLASMPVSFAASKEVIELQRDVAQLQDQVRSLQKTLDQLTVLVQQSLNSGDKTNTSLAVMQSNLNDAIKRQQDSVTTPVVDLGTKVDQMSEDFRNLRETVNDVGARMGKLDSKITDLTNTINVIRTAPAAPPPTTGTTPPGGGPAMMGSTPAATSPTATMPATTPG